LIEIGKTKIKMVKTLRRSALYVPGDNERMLQRSGTISADMLLLNLEDGVDSSKKETARANIVNVLKNIDFGNREVVVRVNSPATETGSRDLAAIVPLGPDGICLPKVQKAGEISDVCNTIRELENRHGIPRGAVSLHAMIESAAGLLKASDIAAASTRMSSLIFGSADYASDVRCQPGEDRFELLLALQMIVTSARSAGIDAIDAPCFDVANHDLLRKEALNARRLGFDGKSAVHPGQLAIINQIFDVTAEEVAWAERVMAELDEAEAKGKALTTLNGKLIENPHRAAAEHILNRSKPR
jgi:citrate lyase subunit beta/citryl-CoA lyase